MKTVRSKIPIPLTTSHPEIAEQWHPQKNGELKPSEVSAGSGKKVWWECSKSRKHSYQTTPEKRAKREHGCPYCSGHKVDPQTNSLAAMHPNIAKQWHPEKNCTLRPSEVTTKSNRKVWWLCSTTGTHEWQRAIYDRIIGGTGCPWCSNRKVALENSLLVLDPELANEWHHQMNRTLTAADVSPGSNKKVWWQCRRAAHHVWQTQVFNRALGKRGCPFCSNNKITIDNNLEYLEPLVAQYWHKSLNGDVKASQVSVGSSKKKYWWQCSAGHEFARPISDMVRSKREYGTNGCKICNYELRAENSHKTSKGRKKVETRQAREQVLQREDDAAINQNRLDREKNISS